ncbi:hypothetical protein DL96DRAFT_1811981 [Flagelloscypha sp. PMI_526]|nr:hypothetical protein DL96DRAFT_1811981 [Flagelloscypha sp. PMI_526]
MTSTNDRIELLNPANESDIHEATNVLGESFHWRLFNVGCDESKELHYECLHAWVKDAAANGEVWVARRVTPDDEEEKTTIMGAAMWYGPRQKLFQTPELEQQCGWTEFLGKLSESSRNWWPYIIRESAAGVEDILGKDVRLNNWHLQLLGVHPDFQRRGIGRKLCEVVEQKAKKSGLLTILEAGNPNNAKHVYQDKMGYELKGVTGVINDPFGKPIVSYSVLVKG